MGDPVVKLLSGSIRGSVENHEEGFSYSAFKGIPFAEPPLGKLRFMEAVPKRAWTGILDCRKYAPMLFQYVWFQNITSHNEDGLYMYVFDYDGPDLISKKILKDSPSGANNMDDTPFVLKMRFLELLGIDYFKKGTKSYRVMEQMMEMWANFDKYGRPTVGTSELILVNWLPIVDGTLLRYLSIDEDLLMKSMINVDQKLLSAKSIRV